MSDDKLYDLCQEYVNVHTGLKSLTKGVFGDGVDKVMVARHNAKLKELESEMRGNLLRRNK